MIRGWGLRWFRLSHKPPWAAGSVSLCSTARDARYTSLAPPTGRLMPKRSDVIMS